MTSDTMLGKRPCRGCCSVILCPTTARASRDPGCRPEMGQNRQAFERSSASHAGPLANHAPWGPSGPLHVPAEMQLQLSLSQRGSAFPFAQGCRSASGSYTGPVWPRSGSSRQNATKAGDKSLWEGAAGKRCN